MQQTLSWFFFFSAASWYFFWLSMCRKEQLIISGFFTIFDVKVSMIQKIIYFILYYLPFRTMNSDIPWEGQIYQIVLVSGHHFHNLILNYETIYQNFCFLSYMSDLCRIRILDRFYFKENPSICICQFQFYYGSEQGTKRLVRYMFQIKKQVYGFEKERMEIEYALGEEPDKIPQNNRFFATFRKKKQKKIEYICIDIEDQEKWIQKNFSFSQKNIKAGRLSRTFQLKPHQIQYFFQEPKKKRTKQIKGKHFSLALQGGGVKGINYMGAYLALKEHYGEDLNVKSVIGSSAGGILGLGIVCGIPIQKIKKLCVEYLRNIAQLDKKYRNIDRKKENQFLQILHSFIEDYGIVDTPILSKISEILLSPEFQKSMIDLLGELNEDIKSLFSYSEEQEISFYGLLMGGLMTGETLKSIAIKTLNFFAQIRNLDVSKQWAEKLTLKQLYEINEIQFTCTAVDLDHHILRFFNHKTTPDLPVCAAVQLTGSFPVAFESQTWKKQWGKYYVHFGKTRREIDLWGTKFTDGGMLANFPLRYLDNERMRSKYFSHPKVAKKEGSEDETILIGLGLKHIEEKNEQKEKKIKEKLNSLFEVIQSKLSFFSMMKFIPNLLKRTFFTVQKQITITKKENPFERLSRIPAIKFVFNLIQTYMKSKDNLTQQCFYFETYATTEPKRENQDDLLFGRYDHERFQKQIKKMRDSFSYFIFNEILQSKSPYYIIMQNLNYFKRTLQNMEKLEKNVLQISEILSSFLIKYCFQRSEENGQNFNVRKMLFKRLIEMDIMNTGKIFHCSNIERDMETLKGTIECCIEYFSKAHKGDFGEGEKKLMQEAIAFEQKKQISRIRDLSKKLIFYLSSLSKKQNLNCQSYIPMDSQTVYQLFGLKTLGYSIKYENVRKFMNQLRKFSIIQLLVVDKAFNNRTQIMQYVRRTLYKQYICKSEKYHDCGIHIIMESARRSELYFHEYIRYMKEAIKDFNKEYGKQLQIKQMTGSNYHSLIIFLHASDLSQSVINQEVWKLKSLIRINETIDRDYSEFQWAKTNTTKMRELQNFVWNHRYDIFEHLNEDLTQKYKAEKVWTNFKKNFPQKTYHLQHSTDQINEAIQISLNFITSSISEVEGEEKEEQRVKKIAEKLSFNLGGGQNYLKKNKKNSEQTIILFKFFFAKYVDIIRYFIHFAPSVSEQITKYLSLSERKQAWKGVIIGETLKAFYIKEYVSKKLLELGLKSNTTLREFYDLSQKKINMSFSAVESQTNSIIFLNYKTRPAMPVWAAILATCSIPFFFKPLPDRKQWNYSPQLLHEDRITKAYFSQENSIYNYYQSADMLMKHPLELVTNHKIRSIISDQPTEICLTLNFSDEEFPDLHIVNKIKTQPITTYDLIFKARNLPQNFFNLVSSVPVIEQNLKVLNLYVSSHDNLIINIYKDQLALLPIRLGTLDFAKMTNSQKTNFSSIATDGINQAKYIVKEKLQNNDDKEKVIYFMLQKKIEEGKKKFGIRFLSMLNPCKSLLSQYKIFYKLGLELDFREIEDEYVKLYDGNYEDGVELKLRIDYPEEKIKKNQKVIAKESRYYIIKIKKFITLYSSYFSSIYRLVYNQSCKKTALLPVQLLNQSSKYAIELKSFAGDKHDCAFFCNNCMGDGYIELGEELGDCFNQCKSNILMFQCADEDCGMKFCILCKYKLKFSEKSINCCLGHEIVKREERFSVYREEVGYTFGKCDFCSSGEFVIYFDKECNVEICGGCKLKLML